MKTIGLTGGIGSGKSVVAQLLEIRGIPVYNTDKAAKRLTAGSLTIKEALCQRFGQTLYSGGTLDKTLLASLIFNQEDHLQYVNAVVHPEVQKDFLQWQIRHNHLPWVALESAILFESGFDGMVDISINVSAPCELRIERVQQRDQINREAVLNRMHHQMSEEERKRKVDYIILNDNCRALLPQIENVLKSLSY
jgi:dephospho-CoA kinase